MRMSEAMRLGSMLGPQAFGAFARPRRKYWLFGPVVTEYCAFAAAHAAIGGGYLANQTSTGVTQAIRGTPAVGDVVRIIDIPDDWLRLLSIGAGCPVENCVRVATIGGLIPHLNDDHRWTREQIAAFIESMEDCCANLQRSLEALEVTDV